MSRIRNTGGFFAALGVGAVAFYCAGFGQFPPAYYRSLMVLAAAGVVLFTKPLAETLPFLPASWRLPLTVVDVAMFALLCEATRRFIIVSDDVESAIVILSNTDVWVGFAAIICLLDLTRRVFGMPIVIVTTVALLFLLFGNDIPGFFHHRGFSISQMVEHLWFGFLGIFGLPTAVILDFVMIFVIFGTVLEGTGAGERLLKIVYVFTGWTRGGPAHAAVWASCLFGTMSGSVTANVVGTGTFTIPMIRRRGFTPHFAGAVEAAASSGGQIMPPVMGAAAFLMAELTGIPYAIIAVGALVPAVFFYGSIFATVAIEARKRGITVVPKSERPKLTLHDWFLSIQILGPIATIVFILVAGRSAAAAGFWATIVAVILAFLNPEFRKKPAGLFRALSNGGRAGSALLVSAAALGAIIGTMEVTGLGIKFANLVLSLSETNFTAALLMTMASCILLGMGMPTLPAYLIIVLVMGPAIAKFGVPLLAVHLFVMYYGVLSNVTPPVAMAAYAAAPIAGANPMKIGFSAVRVAIIGFIVPFVFVYEPMLLIVATKTFEPITFLYAVVRLILAIWLLTTGLALYERSNLPLWEGAIRVVLAGLVLFGGHADFGPRLRGHRRERRRRRSPPLQIATPGARADADADGLGVPAFSAIGRSGRLGQAQVVAVEAGGIDRIADVVLLELLGHALAEVDRLVHGREVLAPDLEMIAVGIGEVHAKPGAVIDHALDLDAGIDQAAVGAHPRVVALHVDADMVEADRHWPVGAGGGLRREQRDVVVLIAEAQGCEPALR